MARSALLPIIVAAILAADVVAQEKEPAFPSIQAAIEALGKDEFETRQQASDFLWKSGKAAQPALEKAIDSDDAEVRLRAMLVLRKVRLGITPNTPPELHTLISQFYDGDRNARQQVINQLRQKQAFDTLFALLQLETDPTSRQLFFSTMQSDIQRMAPQMVARQDLSLLEQWLELGKSTESGRSPYTAFVLLRDRLPEALKKAQAEYEKNKEDPAAALLVASLLRAKGEKKQALELAASVKAPSSAWLQGLSREMEDWERLAALHAEVSKVPRTELHRLAVRGTAYRLAANQAAADEAFQQLKTQAPTDDIWFAAKALLLNDRPKEAIELLSPGLKPMAFDLLIQRQEHQAALDLAGIKPETTFNAEWLANLLGQQSVRTSRTVDRFAFAVTIASNLRSLGKQKQFEELHAFLVTAASADDSRGIHWQQLARLERQPGRQKQLLEMYSRGAKSNYQAALSALFGKKFAKALIWWEVLEGDPRWQDPLARLTTIAVSLQPDVYARHAEVDWPEVAKYVDSKASNDPTEASKRARYHTALAEGWAARNDKKLADLHWQAACAADPSGRDAYAESLFTAERWVEAAAQYQLLTDALPGNAVAWYLRGIALRRTGKEDEGRKLQDTANLMCLDAPARYTLAYQLNERGLKVEAHEQWLLLQRVGHTEDTSVTIAHQYLGNQISEQEPLAAADHWEQLRFHLLRPTTNLVEQAGYLDLAVSIHRARARGLLAKGDKAGAVAQLKRTQELLPGSIKVVEEFTPLLRKAGLTEDADRLFEDAFKIHRASAEQFPDSAMQLNNSAWVAAVTANRLDEALPLAERAVKLAPESASYADTLAEVHFARGDRDQALTWARKAVELEPENKLHEERLKSFSTRELPTKTK